MWGRRHTAASLRKILGSWIDIRSHILTINSGILVVQVGRKERGEIQQRPNGRAPPDWTFSLPRSLRLFTTRMFLDKYSKT